MKICSKCHRHLPSSAFNQCSRNKSGLRAECRECQHSLDAIYRSTKEAKLVKRKYQQSERGREVQRKADRKRDHTSHRLEYKRLYIRKRREDPYQRMKDAARDMVNNAIKAGRFHRGEQCEFAHTGKCSGKLLAHHDDYSKPFDVRWLCSSHDYQIHNH